MRFTVPASISSGIQTTAKATAAAMPPRATRISGSFLQLARDLPHDAGHAPRAALSSAREIRFRCRSSPRRITSRNATSIADAFSCSRSELLDDLQSDAGHEGWGAIPCAR